MADISETSDDESNESDDEKLIAEARSRFTLCEEAENKIRLEALDDLRFRIGEQWPEEVRNERAKDGRPCLVVNKIPQFIQQITNDQRQNRPSIKVHPVDDSADLETAKVIQGLVRHIEYNSGADIAYDTAFESAVTCGFGFFRVITGYVDEFSFEQEILIKPIKDRFTAYLDPYAKEPDGSDANFGFIFEDVSKEEYLIRYPDSDLAKPNEWQAFGASVPSWVKEGSCRLTEYFYKVIEEKELVLLSSGETVLKEELPEVIPEGITVVKERKTLVPIIKWCKLNGVEILEQTDWLGKWIPLVPVYGADVVVDGVRILEGVIRNAKDPARMYNYYVSAETESIGLAPRAPFIVAEGQLEGFQDQWASANRRNHAYLPYKPISSGGVAVPPPQRNSVEPAVMAISQARGLAGEDIKAVTGIYDASLGNRSNETSGIAIQRRNVQAQTSNFHFVDNLTRSLRHTGRILIDLIPKIYDTERTARIIGEDGEQKVIKVNAPTQVEGKDVLYQLDTGKYDVTVDVGPSFASKRQEAAQSMLELAKVSPSIMGLAGDLMVKAMDWQGAQEIAERIKKTLPPGVADDKQAPQELPPQAKQQMDQMGALIDQLTKQLGDATQKIETKSIELESRERIEMAKLETQATIELAKLESKESLTLLENQIADARARLTSQIEELDQRTKQIGFNEPWQAQESAPPEPSQPEPQGQDVDPTGGESPGLPMEGDFQ